jgi:hypothetical protein
VTSKDASQICHFIIAQDPCIYFYFLNPSLFAIMTASGETWLLKLTVLRGKSFKRKYPIYQA